jgi:phage baseplate assembly protein V
MAETKPKRRYQSVNQLETGIVSAVRLAPTPRVRVKFPDRGNLESYWLRVLSTNTQNNKDFWMPDVGEQVECLLDEKFRNGIVLGSSYSSADVPPAGMTLDKRHTTFKDGATLEYDRALHVLTHLAQDNALIKYDAVAHQFTISLPASGLISIAIASGGSVSYDGSGNWKIEPGAGKVLIADAAGGTQPVARIGDTVVVNDPDDGPITGHITSGSSKVSAGG